MLRFIGKRVLLLIPVVLGIVTLTFFLMPFDYSALILASYLEWSSTTSDLDAVSRRAAVVTSAAFAELPQDEAFIAGVLDMWERVGAVGIREVIATTA